VDGDRGGDEHAQVVSSGVRHAQADTSLNECTVITATIRTAFRASAPRNAPTIKFSLRGIA